MVNWKNNCVYLLRIIILSTPFILLTKIALTQTPIGKIIDFDKQWSLIIMRPEILANIYIYFEGDIVYIEDSKKNRHPVVIGAVSKQNQKISLIDNSKNLSQLLSTYKIGDLVYDTRKDLAKEKAAKEKAAKEKAYKEKKMLEKAAKEKAAKEKAYKEKKMLEKAAKGESREGEGGQGEGRAEQNL